MIDIALDRTDAGRAMEPCDFARVATGRLRTLTELEDNLKLRTPGRPRSRSDRLPS